MKWFKHLSGSLNDSFVFSLIQKFGGDGYMVFFGMIELMTDEYDVNNPGISRFPVRKLTKNFQISVKKLTNIAHFLTEKGKIIAEFNGDSVTLNCPRLKELMDEYTMKKIRRNVRTLSGECPEKIRVEVEVEEDIKIKDKEREYKEKEKAEPPLIPLKGEEIVKPDHIADVGKKVLYSESFELFWKAYPKKVGKGAAYKSWENIKKRKLPVKPKEIIESLELQIQANHFGNDPQYIPMPATWLNQNRWEDEVIEPQSSHLGKPDTSKQEQAEKAEIYERYLLHENAEQTAQFREMIRDWDVNAISRSAYIDPLLVVSMDEEHVTLWSPPDSWQWVNDHYRERIEEYLREQGHEMVVIITGETG